MKAQMNFNSTYIKLALITLSAALLTSCGTSKSNPTTTSSSVYDFSASKQLANCNKTKDTNFSINTSSVADQTGQSQSDWIKLKFNMLSTTVTASGNTIRFFKWRVVGGVAQMDNTPLSFALYDISSGTTVGATTTSMNVASLSASYGLYIQMNDPNFQYQVLKAIVYDASGTIVAQQNSLIPGFYASPIDYQYNSDGTPRTITLQQMHPLYGQDVSTWTSLQLQTYFNQYCF